MNKNLAKTNIFLLVIALAVLFAIGIFSLTVVTAVPVSETEAEAFTTGGTAIGTADALKNVCRANQSGTYYLSSNITWTSAGYNQSYTFSGTLYGNGKTITISTGNTTRTKVGDNVNIGMLFSVLSGTIRDCTIVVNDATYWYQYTGSSTSYTDYAGVICGKLNGGTIINVDVSIANGKGLSFYAEDDDDDSSGGYGCMVGAYAGHTAGTSTIKNCTLTLNGGIWGKSEDWDGNGNEGTSSRCHVGGFVGEVDSSTTLNMYNNRFVGSTTGIVGSGLINSDSDHRSGRTGGIVGVVRSSATCTINALLYEFCGSVHCFRDRDTKCGLLVGYNYGTCTVSNIVVPNNITTTRDEGNKGDGGNPAVCYSASSITSTAAVTHTGAISNGSANAGTNVTITNSITYDVNAFLGSSSSSSYGTFKLSLYIDAAGSTGGWNATVTPTSSYCVSDILYGSTYKNCYTTKRNNGTAYTLWVSSGCTAYAGYVAQQGNSVAFTNDGKTSPYDGTGWSVQAKVTIASTAYTLNYCSTTAYYHSQNASGGEVTSAQLSSSSSKATTSKNVGVYTMALRTGTGANASLLASGTCIYRDTANAPTKVGYYNGQTGTVTTTKKELSLTITNNIDTAYAGQSTQNVRSKIYISGMVGSEAMRFFVTKQAKTFSSNSGTSWEENSGNYSGTGYSGAGDYWHRINNTYIYFSAYDAGTYTMAIVAFDDATNSTGGLASNYTWSAAYDTEAERSSTFTINPREVSLSWSGTSYTYDKASHTPSCTAGNLISGDSCSVTVSGGKTNAGTYTATASSLSNGNYCLPSAKTTSFTISPKTISLVKTVTGQSYTYNGAKTAENWENRATVSISGMVSGDSIRFWYNNFADSDLDNVVYVCKNNDSGKEYTYPMNAANTTAISGKTCGEYYTLGATGNEVSFCARNVGSYSIVVLGMTTSSNGSVTNYTWATDSDTEAERTVTFSVTKKAATLSWGTTSFTYNASVQTPTCTAGSLCSGDSCSVTVTGGKTAVGSYTATASSLSNGNYALPSATTTTFTINQKTVSLTWGTTSFTYNASVQTPTCTAGSVCSGDSCSVTVTGGKTAVGSYTATASSLSNGNYVLPSATTTTFTINQKTVSLTWGTTSFTYNGSVQTPTCTAGSVCSGDSCSVTVTGGQTDAGSYTATASALSNGNYALPSVKTTAFTVHAKEITLTLSSNIDSTYVGQSTKNVRAQLTVNGQVGNDQLRFYINKQAKTYSSREGGGWEENNQDLSTSAYPTAGDFWHLGNQALRFSAYDVGSYSFYVMGFDSNGNNVSSGNKNNYTWSAAYDTEAERTVTFTIDAKTVSLTWGATSFTYNKTVQNPTCTAGSLCDGDVCTVTVTGGQTNQGSYTATAAALSNTNYALPTANTKSFVINKKEVALSWGSATFTYNKTTQKPTCTAESLCDGDTCIVTVTGEQTDVGDYTATAAALSNTNYALPTETTQAFVINKKEVALSWGATSFTYNKTAQEPTCTAESLCDGDTCIVTVTGEQTNVGEYTATAAALSNTNYALPTATTQAFVINKKEVTLSWGATSFTYNKTAQKPSCTAESLCDGDACIVTVTGEQTNVGEYTATAAALSNTNYILPTANTQDFIINKKEVTLSWGATSFTYNKTAQKPTCTAENICDGDACIVTVVGEQTVVGEYIATATALSNGNYALPSETAKDFSIAPKTVVFGWGTSTFVYDNTEKLPTCAVTNLCAEDICTVTVTGRAVGAGTYTATATALSDGNYALPTVCTHEFTVQKAVYDMTGITFESETYVYDGMSHGLVIGGTLPTGLDGITVTVSYGGSATDVDDGAVNCFAIFDTASANYELPETKQATVRILAKEIVIEWCEDEFTYNGVTQQVTASYLPLSGEARSLAVRFDGTFKNYVEGGYTATASFAETDNNYCLPKTVTRTYHIKKKSIVGAEITLTDSLVYNGENQTQTVEKVTVDGLDVSFDVEGNVHKDAGTYMLTVSGNGNFAGSATQEYTIAQKEVTVTAKGVEITYGEDVKNNGVRFTGLVGEDALDGTVDFDYTYTRYGDVGTYALTPKGLSSENYAVSYASGDFIVVQKVISVLVTPNGGTYGNVVESTACFGDGCIENNDEITIFITYFGTDNNGEEYQESATVPTEAGSYTVRAAIDTEGKAKNYLLPTTTNQFMITKADYNIYDVIGFVGGQYVYDGTEHTLAVTVKKASEIVVDYENNGRTEVGSQEVTATFSGYDLANYNEIESMKATLTITALSIAGATVTLGDALIYNGEKQTQTVASVTVGTLCATFDVGGNEGTDAGTYTLTVTGNGNYYGTVEADFTVQKLSVEGATVTLGAQLIYNGKQQTQTVVSVVKNGRNVTYTLSNNVQTDVGAEEYALTVTAVGNFTGTLTEAWNILPKDISASEITLGAKLTYNGEKQTQAVTAVETDGLVATFDVSGNQAQAAGEYELTVTGKGNFCGTNTKAYEIAKKKLTVTAMDKSIAYGQQPSDNGVSYAGFVAEENERSLQGEVAFSYGYERFGNVGTYDITVDGYESENYDISYVKGTLTVTKFVTALTWDTTVLRYTAQEQIPTCTIFVYDGDECEPTLSGYGTEVGSYTATAISLSNANYALPNGTTYAYEILPCLTARPIESTLTYTYSGEEYTYTFASETDEAHYEIMNDKRTKAGTQTVTVALKDGKNYCWDNESSADLEYEFTVQKLVLTEPTVPNLTYTGVAQKGTVTDDNLGKYFTVTENKGGTDVGEYGIEVTLTSDDCAWAYADTLRTTLPYSILQAKNYWTSGPQVDSITYGESLVPNVACLYGEVKYLFKKASGEEEFSATVPTNAGDYVFLFKVDETLNYKGLNKEIAFSIAKASFDLSALAWTDGSFTYDGRTKTVTVTGVPQNVVPVYANNEKINAGTYTASVAFEYDAVNYNEVALEDLIWEILPKTVTAIWEEKEYVFDGTVLTAPRAYYTDGETEIDLTVTEADGKEFRAAGEYTFVAVHSDGNYAADGASERKTYAVAKKKIAKPQEDKTVYYCTGTEQSYGVVSGEGYTASNGTRAEAGSQEVTIRLDETNYEWADGTSDEIVYVFTVQHKFSEHNGDPTRLLREATCTESAVYTAVCACGETEEYVSGEPLGHDYIVTFAWTAQYAANATVRCGRCEYAEEQECAITVGTEGGFTYYFATVEIEGKSYIDKKIKGAAVYLGVAYDAPVWTWTTAEGEYAAVAVFNGLSDQEAVYRIDAELEYNDTEKDFTVTASVRFGDEETLFTDRITVEKIAITLCREGVADIVAYYRPYVLATESIATMILPEEGKELLGFKTADGVYLPYKDNTLPEYRFVEAETVTALYRESGNVTLIALDEDGEKLDNIFFEMSNSEGTRFEGSIEQSVAVKFKNVPFGLYTLKAYFTLSGKQIERTFSVDVNAADVEKEIVLVQSKVNTQVTGDVCCEDLENAATEESDNATSTVILETVQTAEESVIAKMNGDVTAEKHNQTLVNFIDVSVVEKIKTVDENGKVSETTKAVASSVEPITIKMDIPDDVYEALLSRKGTPDDVVVYMYDKETDTTVKLPKAEYAHDSVQFYSVHSLDARPYVMLSVNAFGTFAIGIQEKIVQEVNEFLSLSIADWVYGSTANTPVSDAKFGTVKYLFAKKDSDTFSETVPVNAGSYLLKAYVEEEEEYSGLEQVVEFTIEKATYNLSRIAFGDKRVVCDGSEYTVEILGSLPDGVNVVYENNVGSAVGQYTVVAHFYGDNENYNPIPDQTVTLTIEDKTTWTLRTYWWAFAFGGFFVVMLLVALALRSRRGGRGERGGDTMFDYRIGQ